MQSLRNALSSHNGFVRKGARAVLLVPKWAAGRQAVRDDFAKHPPVLANSFPKSGTHLLVQILEGLPDRANYGEFLGSVISSFQFRERTAENTCRFIRRFVPGEIVRGHLYFDPRYAEQLAERNVVHYFIYRDPRDVVVSEAHYLREMNRWHRLTPYFRKLESIDDAIMLSINGLEPPVAGIDFPNIAERFARYRGWLSDSGCFTLKFEDLISERRPELIQQLAEFYVRQSGVTLDLAACVAEMSGRIAPQKSHTFRSGKKAGWQREFTAAHRERFAEIAGDLLVELGYEPNLDWATEPVASPA